MLGHELAHVSGRDILPATVSAALAVILTAPAALARLRPARGRAPRSAPDRLGLLEEAAMLVTGPVAALVIQLSVARRREYRADAVGALLCGDPVALARALRQVEISAVDQPLLPGARLLSVSHLMLVSPFSPVGLARLFVTHPATGERLRRLEALAGSAADRSAVAYGATVRRPWRPVPPSAMMGTVSIQLHSLLASGLGQLRIEPTAKRIRAVLDGVTVLDSTRAMLVWEPRRIVPSYAVPVDDVRAVLGPGGCGRPASR